MGIKKKRLRLLVGLLVVFLGLGFVGQRLSHPAKKETETTRHTLNCTNGGATHASLSKSNDPILHKLHEYEAVCKGAVVDTMMFFTAMPTTNEEATTLAQATAIRLKEFSKYKIKPLVSFEPNVAIPTIINDIHGGKYDSILTSYFQSLKASGISNEQLGTWILFPEANTPTWHNTDPAIFAGNVVKVATLQRQVFPSSQLTILLNNTTYAADDTDWSHGTKKDLRPYVKSIPAGTLNSFGYQGFPFVSPKNTPNQYGQLDAKDFLRLENARDAAKTLRTKDIWLNTGTFRLAHTDTNESKVMLSLDQRRRTLESITHQAVQLQNQGFTVSVNLFAKDKSKEMEHIDWSYWPSKKYSTSPDTELFRTFYDQLREHNIHRSLHDAS